MAKCERIGCGNEANPQLVHRYTGRVFCEKCAKQINQWNSQEEVVPFPKNVIEAPDVRRIEGAT